MNEKKTQQSRKSHFYEMVMIKKLNPMIKLIDTASYKRKNNILKDVQENIDNFKNDLFFCESYNESFNQELDELYDDCIEKIEDFLNKYIELYIDFKDREENAKMILDDVFNIRRDV